MPSVTASPRVRKRSNPAKPPQRMAEALAEARRLCRRYRHREAIALLRRFGKSRTLTKQQAAKLTRRIDRLVQREKRRAANVEKSVELARAHFAKARYAEAAGILAMVPERDRTGDAREILRRSRDSQREVTELAAVVHQARRSGNHAQLAHATWRLVALKPQDKQFHKLAEHCIERTCRRAGKLLQKQNGAAARSELEKIPREHWTYAVRELSLRAELTVTTNSGSKVAAQSQYSASGASACETTGSLYQRITDSTWTPWLLAAYVVVLLMVLVYRASRSPRRISMEEIHFRIDDPNDDQISLIIAPTSPEPAPQETVPQEPAPTEVEPEPEERTDELAVPEPIVESAEEAVAVEPDPPERLPSVPEPPTDETVLTNLVTRGDGASDASPATEPAPPADPTPARAVTSGSFSVWLDPPFPRSGEPYSIYIQVRLPERIKRYTWGDLSGYVMGSDGYRKAIQGHRRQQIPLSDHTATIVVPVVGAERLEMDTIVIRSRILKQQRMIELHHPL